MRPYASSVSGLTLLAYAAGARRRKLLDLLEQSSYYSPDRILSKLPMVDLYEERAVILSKLGEHEGALTIYAHRLGDIEMAHQARL